MTRDLLILRLDAPLMSFGGVAVDQRRTTAEFPRLSMLAGLLGNALGYDHREARALDALQGRIRYAVRRDVVGERLTDFQTVALGDPHLVDTGWTTRGVGERRGGASSETTHIRYREYWADAVFTVAFTLEPRDEPPDLNAVEAALREPERPLFIGRKPCLPSCPLLVCRAMAPTLRAALEAHPRVRAARAGREPAGPLLAWIPPDEIESAIGREIPVVDERDWENQIVVGRRIMSETLVNPPEADHDS